MEVSVGSRLAMKPKQTKTNQPAVRVEPATINGQVEAARVEMKRLEEQLRAKKAELKQQAKQEREAKKQAKVLRATCAGTKKNGQPCSSKCIEGSDRCIDHQTAYNRLTVEERATLDGLAHQMDGETLADLLGWYQAKRLTGWEPKQPVAKAEKAEPKTAKKAA